MGRFRPHFPPFALLFLATLVFLWPVPLGAFQASGERWTIPQGGGDLESFIWPTYRYAAASLRSGEIPLWNPYLYSGAPFLADNQSGLLYPPNLALALLPDVSYGAIEWLVFAHVLLAGAGMYALGALEFAGARASATIAALAFMFSSVFVTHVGNLNIVAVSAWLPWLIVAVRRLAATGKARWAGALGVAGGVSVLAGHAQMSLVIALGAAIVFTWELLQRRSSRLLALGALALAIAIGISAPAVLPAIEMTAHTTRATLPYQEASRYSLPPIGLIEVATPLLFGRGARAFWPAWDRVEMGYAGLVTVFLAGLAFARQRRPYGYVAVALTGLAIALGSHAPFHAWLYQFVPGFGQLRVPARFVLLMDFGVSLLAGYGVANLRAGRITRRRLLAWSGALAVSVLGATPAAWIVARNLSGAAPATLAPALAVALFTLIATTLLCVFERWRWLAALAAIELIALGAWVEVDRRDPDAGYRSGPAVNYLRAQPGPFRIDVAATAWQPDAPAVHQLESVAGISNPLALARYDAYYWSVGYRGSPLYNLLNVQFLIADKGKPAADASFVPVHNEDPDVDVYLNTNGQPRIRLVSDVIYVSGAEAAFEAVHAPSFDPLTQVVLESGASVLAQSSDALRPQNLFYLEYKPHRQRIAVEATTPAVLVMSEVWYPGWRATIDGESADVLRADYALRALVMPAGAHEVVVEFKPSSWKFGLAAAMATVGALLVAGVWVRLRKLRIDTLGQRGA